MVDAGSVKGSFIIDDSQANDAMNRSVKNTKKVESSFGTMVKSVFTAQAAYAAFTKVLSFGRQKFVESIKNARDLGEETNKFKVVFKGVVPQAIKMRDELVKAYGMSRVESTRALSAFQDFLVPMGIAREEAAGLSDEFIKMAVDIGSFNNAPTAQVLESIKSGIAGMSRPLRQFGIDISENTLKQMALAQGITLVNGVLDRQDRALLIAQKIAKDSADAMGDFGRTSQDLANRQKILGSVLEDVSSNLGERFLPTMNDAAGAAISLAKAFEKMTRTKLSDTLREEQVELNALVSSITNVNTPTDERQRLIKKLNEEYPSFLENLDSEKVSNEELKNRLREVNDAYVNRIILQKENENIEKLAEKTAGKKSTAIKKELQIQREIADLALKLKIPLDALNGTYGEQANVLKKALGTHEGLKLSYRDGEEALLNITTKIKHYGLIQKSVTKNEENLTNAQKLKKQIIDSLGMSEEKLINLTTKKQKVEKKGKVIKEEDIELTKEQIELAERQAEANETLLQEFEDLQKSESELLTESIREKKEAYIAAGVDRIAAEKWASGEIQKLQKEENNNLLSMFADIANKAATAATDTGNSIADGIGEITNSVMKGISKMMEGLKDASENLASGILEITAGIAEAVGEIYQAIADMQMDAMEAELEAMEEQDAAKLEALEESKEEQLEEIQTNYDREMEALQAKLDRGDISEKEFAAKKKELDAKKAAEETATTKKMDDKIAEQKKENRKKEDEQKKKIFEANKTNQIAQIWIQTAIGVVSAFAGACQWPGVSMIAGLIFAGVMSGLLIASAIAQTIIIGQQTYTPGMALGGRVEAGDSYMIGERGAETFTPGVSGYITPASITSQILENTAKGQKKSTVNNVSFDGATISNQMDLEDVTDYVITKLGQKLETA